MDIKNFRRVTGQWMGLILSVFVIFNVWTVYFQPMEQVTIFFALSFSVAFMVRPLLGKNKKDKPWCLAVDLIFSLMLLAIAAYVWVDYLNLVYRAGMPTPLDNVVCVVGILLTFEGARRTVGWAMIYIAGAFLLYAFLGQYLFPPISHGGYDVVRVINSLFLSENGILGVPMNVMFNFIFLFIVFGALFGEAGGTRFFIDLTRSMFRGVTGGPAKVAVVSSGLMGTISGSAVANVVTTGTFTIPMMKKVGFESHVAGAVESVASTGGQLMPPIMGAAAFVMADYLNVPYLAVVKAAILPAIIFYIAVFAFVHFYTLKLGIKRESDADLPPVRKIIKDFWVFLPPLFVLVYFLIAGYSTSLVVMYTIIVVVGMSVFKREFRLGPRKLFNGLTSAANESVTVTGACAAAGMVIAVVLLTGLGVKIGNLVIYFSGGNLGLGLIFIMLASLVLGMGMPTLVCYILLAVTTAPPLIAMGVPPMAAHLFIFYFGMLSMVTPPVGMAFYAGAAVAGADTMKTGWTAWKIALAGFLLPFMFVYSPSLLLMGNPIDAVLASITAVVGAAGLSVGVVGYIKRPLGAIERVAAMAAALLLIKPGWITDVIGIVIIVGLLLMQRSQKGLSRGRAV
ncbi:MAG: C4-dicarboxylate ABC transporter permease [Deltaproteobacteria bacterium HGW-Deltaproteobacteria-15]|nr:MAG: C4-dicarboxylate ABC transporter permease [Deltaproteobacteria bacterium HGW-Deltaproteobacteria-15]